MPLPEAALKVQPMPPSDTACAERNRVDRCSGHNSGARYPRGGSRYFSSGCHEVEVFGFDRHQVAQAVVIPGPGHRFTHEACGIGKPGWRRCSSRRRPGVLGGFAPAIDFADSVRRYPPPTQSVVYRPPPSIEFATGWSARITARTCAKGIARVNTWDSGKGWISTPAFRRIAGFGELLMSRVVTSV